MMKRTIIILSLILGQLWPSHGQVMMLFSSDSLSYITSPLAIDSLFYWFDASQGVLDSLGGAIATDEGVGTWQDQSGNGYHVTQTTDTDRPVYKATGGPGSKPCIQFDGSDDFLVSAAHFWGSDDLTIIVVVKFGDDTPPTSYFVVCRLTTTTNRQWDFWLGEPSVFYRLCSRHFRDGTISNVAQYSSSDNRGHTYYRVHVATQTGTSTGNTLYSDGGNEATTRGFAGTGDDTIYNSSGKLSIGTNFPDGTPTTFLFGSISEIIVYSRAITATERVAVENYLNKKYDLY